MNNKKSSTQRIIIFTEFHKILLFNVNTLIFKKEYITFLINYNNPLLRYCYFKKLEMTTEKIMNRFQSVMKKTFNRY